MREFDKTHYEKVHSLVHFGTKQELSEYIKEHFPGPLKFQNYISACTAYNTYFFSHPNAPSNADNDFYDTHFLKVFSKISPFITHHFLNFSFFISVNSYSFESNIVDYQDKKLWEDFVFVSEKDLIYQTPEIFLPSESLSSFLFQRKMFTALDILNEQYQKLFQTKEHILNGYRKDYYLIFENGGTLSNPKTPFKSFEPVLFAFEKNLRKPYIDYLLKNNIEIPTDKQELAFLSQVQDSLVSKVFEDKIEVYQKRLKNLETRLVCEEEKQILINNLKAKAHTKLSSNTFKV